MLTIERVGRSLALAADEEDVHARLCEKAARFYGAQVSMAEPKSLNTRSNSFEWHMQLITLACLSETCATHYLEFCLRRASDESSKNLLRALLRDEVGHAQLGWAHFSSLPWETRGRITEHLGDLTATTKRAWHERVDEIHATPLASHGFPAATECKQVIDEVLAAMSDAFSRRNSPPRSDEPSTGRSAFV